MAEEKMTLADVRAYIRQHFPYLVKLPSSGDYFEICEKVVVKDTNDDTEHIMEWIRFNVYDKALGAKRNIHVQVWDRGTKDEYVRWKDNREPVRAPSPPAFQEKVLGYIRAAIKAGKIAAGWLERSDPDSETAIVVIQVEEQGKLMERRALVDKDPTSGELRHRIISA